MLQRIAGKRTAGSSSNVLIGAAAVIAAVAG